MERVRRRNEFQPYHTPIKVKWYNTSSGSINAYISSTSGNSCSQSSNTKTVTKISIPTPIISNSSFLICGSGTTTINANAVSNATHYVWTLPSGFSASNLVTTSPSLTVNYTTTASGSITVRGRNTNCVTGTGTYSEGYKGTKSITRTPGVPQLSSSDGRVEMCSGESRTYTATPSNGVPTNYGYDWYATNGLLINGGSYTASSPLHTTTNSVTVIVALTGRQLLG